MINFENESAVPAIEADRGELEELREILEEAGYGNYIEEQIEAGVRMRACEMLRDLLLDVIYPPKGSKRLVRLMIKAYAIGVPGLPTMGRCAVELGLGKSGKSAISKGCVKYCKDYGLPPSSYMKSEEARETYKKTNQIKRKQ